MKTDQVVSAIRPILLKYGVTRSDLFGSIVGGDYGDESDVDILVDVPKGTSLFDLVHLQRDLEGALNRKVDLLTYRSVNKYVKKYIFEDTYKVI